MRIAHLMLSGSFALLLTAGCGGAARTDGERPGVLAPEPGAAGTGAVASAPAGTAGDRVLAEVEGVKITESQVLPVLYDAYGLDVLIKVTQLAMARAATAAAGMGVAPADVEAERQLTLKLAFPEQKPEDYDNLLGQLLTQQRVSRAEFAVLMETNAHLRALAKGPASADLSEDAIRAEFNQVYGERVQLRHIALNNLQEVAEAQRRLAAKQPFERVAREMSVNRLTAENGGALPPLARTSGGYSDVFLQAAFALKPGEVSGDAIQEDRYYHLIKVEERLAPRAVKFEDVRDSVRDDLVRRRENGLMAARRTQMAQLAIRALSINEPTLKRQFDERLAAANPKPADRDQVRRDLDEQRDRLNATTNPTTAPATLPAMLPTEP